MDKRKFIDHYPWIRFYSTVKSPNIPRLAIFRFYRFLQCTTSGTRQNESICIPNAIYCMRLFNPASPKYREMAQRRATLLSVTAECKEMNLLACFAVR